MTKKVLNIGEIAATRNSGTITCYGLGSCVGVFLYDRKNNIGGGAHIALPGSGYNPALNNSYAEQALELLLAEMHKLGSDLSSLRAKIIGGANLFESSMQIGLKNVQSVKKLLTHKKIYIASEDTGGTKSRTGHFSLTDGSLTVNTPTKKYNI